MKCNADIHVHSLREGHAHACAHTNVQHTHTKCAYHTHTNTLTNTGTEAHTHNTRTYAQTQRTENANNATTYITHLQHTHTRTHAQTTHAHTHTNRTRTPLSHSIVTRSHQDLSLRYVCQLGHRIDGCRLRCIGTHIVLCCVCCRPRSTCAGGGSNYTEVSVQSDHWFALPVCMYVSACA